MAEILNVLLEGTGRRLSNRLEGAIMGQQNQKQPAQRKVFAESRGAARKIGMTEGNAMFHITLITVGKLKERYYAAAADEYIRRLGAYCKFELIELPECRLPDDPNGTQIAAGLAREAEQIEAKLPRGAWFCVLTPEGTELSSEGLAERLQAEKLNGRSAACFLIGSSFGIDARIKRMADFRLSFSKMTFPHHLMRVMALEQLYRAESILAGTKYHK